MWCMNAGKKMLPSFEEDSDTALTREIRQHSHDEDAAGRNLCAAVLISCCTMLSEESAMHALLDDAGEAKGVV